jgi:hypothetical protein
MKNIWKRKNQKLLLLKIYERIRYEKEIHKKKNEFNLFYI